MNFHSLSRAIILTFVAVLPVGAEADLLLHSAPTRQEIDLLAEIIKCEDQRKSNKNLLETAANKDKRLRERAIIALGRIGGKSAVDTLAQIVENDKDEHLRALAAFSLGETEDKTIVNQLLSLLIDKASGTELKARCAEALGKVSAVRDGDEAISGRARRDIASGLVAVLIQAKEPDGDYLLLNSCLLTALLRLKDPYTYSNIAEQLKSQNSNVRWRAAYVLARLKDGIEPYVNAILPLLDDEEAPARVYAARALAAAKAGQAQVKLISMLKDKDERVRASVISALGQMGRSELSLAPMLELAGELLAKYSKEDPAVSGVPEEQNLLLLLCSAMGNLKDAKALTFLKSYRKLTEERVLQPELEIAIAQISEKDFLELPAPKFGKEGNWKSQAAYAQGLAQLKSEPAGARLMEMLAKSPDARATAEILNGIASCQGKQVSSVLLEQLKAPDPIVRATAANLLGESGEKSTAVYEALERAFIAAGKDQMNDARIAILEAADKLRCPLNKLALFGKYRDKDYIVRRRALELARASGQSGIPENITAGYPQSDHKAPYYRRVAELSFDKSNPRAVIYCKKGKIVLELFAAEAPMTVYNFILLAERGFFNGLTFMRVVPNFVIQGGDPRNDMNGGPGYQIRCEINLRKFETGTMGMALSGKDTGGSQFFITHSAQPHLDGGYTVFGRVLSGMELVNRIARDEVIERVEINYKN